MPDGLNLNIEMVRAGLAAPRPGAGEALDAVIEVYAQRAEALGRGMHGEAIMPEAAEPLDSNEPAAAPDGEAPEEDGSEAQEANASATVFVTRSGSKYHRATCRFVSETSREVPIEEARQRYEPGRVCKPDQAVDE